MGSLMPPIARLRFRHPKVVHALRVAVGVLICIAISIYIDPPYAQWITISFLVVTAGLQHHGNIRRKAIERALGTIIGAAVGVLILGQQQLLGLSVLTYLLIAAASAVCAYYAVGKGGYTALLSAITLVIVAGHGTEPIDEGLWRAVNVMIGVTLALVLSLAAPLYATWFWRETLADALRQSAELVRGMGPGAAAGDERPLDTTLQQLRPLMPSVSSETGVPVSALETIQRNLRLVLAGVEFSLLSGTVPKHRDEIVRRFEAIEAALSSTSGAALATAPAVADAAMARDETGDQILLGLEGLRVALAGAPALWRV